MEKRARMNVWLEKRMRANACLVGEEAEGNVCLVGEKIEHERLFSWGRNWGMNVWLEKKSRANVC